MLFHSTFCRCGCGCLLVCVVCDGFVIIFLGVVFIIFHSICLDLNRFRFTMRQSKWKRVRKRERQKKNRKRKYRYILFASLLAKWRWQMNWKVATLIVTCWISDNCLMPTVCQLGNCLMGIMREVWKSKNYEMDFSVNDAYSNDETRGGYFASVVDFHRHPHWELLLWDILSRVDRSAQFIWVGKSMRDGH